MLHDISNDEIITVQRFVAKIRSITYHRTKKDSFVLGAEELTERQRWLLTFACWFCLFNPRWQPIDPSRFHSIVGKDGDPPTFVDALRVIHTYESRGITARREAVLSRFIGRLTGELRHFYFALLSGTFTQKLPLTELQEVLELDRIMIDQVYEPLPPLTTSFADLTYPVLVRRLDTNLLAPAIVAKMGGRKTVSQAPDWLVNGVPAHLKRDLTLAPSGMFALYGYLSQPGKFFPVDMFDKVSEVRVPDAEGYLQRIERLQQFVGTSLLTRIDNTPVAMAHNEEELREALLTVLDGREISHALFTDSNTPSTGIAHTAECRLTKASIEGLWIEDGTARGFLCWLNGIRYQVPMRFSGRDQYVLSNPRCIAGEALSVYYLRLGRLRQVIGKEILWGKSWRRAYSRTGSDVMVEKCILCGDTKWPHVNHGICRSCECNLPYYWSKAQVWEWITPSSVMGKKRAASCWEASLLNAVGYRHRGHKLEAREDGCWRFTQDEESMRLYLEWKEKFNR